MNHGDSASVLVARVMWTFTGDVISASGENYKKPSSSSISPEPSFNGNGNKKTLNVNKTCWK